MVYTAARLFSMYSFKVSLELLQIIGQEDIPMYGPLLLFGNHNNEFNDPLFVTSIIPKKVLFIAAAKSMKRPIIGHLGKALGGIPVGKPQDLAKRGLELSKRLAGLLQIGSILKDNNINFIFN